MAGRIPHRSPSQPVLDVDTVVIGAGIVGLSVLRALSLHNDDVALLDRGSYFGGETSSRNSGVLHAGLYYPPHSLKAKLCVRGKELAYRFLEERSIPHRQCGKLIVATNNEQMATLRKLHQQAQANGVLDTVILNKDETLAREPSVSSKHVQASLYSPSTGIVDAHAWMEQLWLDSEEKAEVIPAYRSKIIDAGLSSPSEHSSRQPRIGLRFESVWLSCRSVVNCAGLHAPQIAQWIHRNTTWKPPRHYFAKGNYYTIDSSVIDGQKPEFQHLVYPVPDPGGLGIHATMDMDGKVRFGPDVQWIDPSVEDPDDIDLDVPTLCRMHFVESIRRYWKDIPPEALVPDYAGIRPKLSHPSLSSHESFQDFIIAGPNVHGVQGLVHLFGIESPGLTSSMAIAEYVANILEVEREKEKSKVFV